MSTGELDRLQILQKTMEHRMTQAAAAHALGLSYRQVKRLMALFRRRGAAGLVSGKRGKQSNRRLPAIYTDHLLELVRERYSDFGPTLAREKLLERHGLLIGRETLIAEANAWIDSFLETYNARFSKPPALPVNVHRHLMDYENLDDTFTWQWQEQRSLSAALTLQYDKVLYLVDTIRENQQLAGKRVTVIDYPDGRIKIRYDGRDLGYREFDKLTHTHQGEVVPHKRLGAMLALISENQKFPPQEKRSIKCPTRRYAAPARLT